MSDQPCTLLLYDDAMLGHKAGAGHPERPARLRAVRDELTRAEIAGSAWRRPEPADRAAIERAHDPGYVERIESLRGRSAWLDPDTAVSPNSVDAAHLASGASIGAVEAVVRGEARSAFALVRPPGHHAETDRAMGFCLYNNAAIAAAHAVAALGIERVLIIDWDVHHGNGTQRIFNERSDVFYFSAHQFPFYPGTGAASEIGAGAGEGFTFNAALPAGLGDGDWAEVFSRFLTPIAEAFTPDLVLVSAGFDAHQNDPLAEMNVTEEGFAHLCGVVRDLADRLADGRLALVLEGGYDLDALAAGARTCVGTLCGRTTASPPEPTEPGRRAIAGISEVLQSLQRPNTPIDAIE